MEQNNQNNENHSSPVVLYLLLATLVLSIIGIGVKLLW